MIGKFKKPQTSNGEQKIIDDLEYRLPGSGKPISAIVLSREQAENLLTTIRELRAENEELKHKKED